MAPLVVLVVENSACQVKFPRMKKRWRGWNPPPGSRLGLTGPRSWWRRGFTDIGGGWITEPAHPDTFFEPFFILLSISPLSAPCLWTIQATWSILLFVLGAAPPMSGQLPVSGGRAPATWCGVSGSQRPFAVAGSKAKSFYNVLQVARTQSVPSTLGVPPLSKRCRCAPTATVLSPTAQELEATASDLSA